MSNKNQNTDDRAFCHKCNKPMKAEFNFGKKEVIYKCPKCGNEIHEDLE